MADESATEAASDKSTREDVASAASLRRWLVALELLLAAEDAQRRGSAFGLLTGLR